MDICEVSKIKLKPTLDEGIPEVTPEQVYEVKNEVRIIDVRTENEFFGELGHIPTAELHDLGEPLMKFIQENDKSQEIVFVCRSGGRSAQATMIAMDMGYSNVMNMSGGMLRWNELGYEVSRE